MITYAFDLYPRDDPKDGARLVRFTNLQGAEWTAEATWCGKGWFTIRSDDAEAAFIDPRGLQYVRVVEIDSDTVDGATTSGFAERVVGGFFLEIGNFKALDEKLTRLLKFGGRGMLSYYQREVLWSRAYLYADDNIIDGTTWHFYLQPSIAGGDFLGAVAWRILGELQSFAAVPTELDDKSETAVPDTAATFGQFNDSAANLWTVPSGEFKAERGDNGLHLIKRLVEAGIYIEGLYDTFQVHAWERDAPSSRGQDKTGAAWGLKGAGPNWVVRLQKPTDSTVPTGNIKADMDLAIGAFVERSVLLVGDNGTYVAVPGASDIPYHGYYATDVQDTDTLTYIGQSQHEARTDASQTPRIPFKLGNDPGNGIYRPFLDEQIQLNDTVTVHTGAGPWDLTEETFPIAAITIRLRLGGDWEGELDLGATFTSMAERAAQAAGVASRSRPPNLQLCRRHLTYTVTKIYRFASNAHEFGVEAPTPQVLHTHDAGPLAEDETNVALGTVGPFEIGAVRFYFKDVTEDLTWYESSASNVHRQNGPLAAGVGDESWKPALPASGYRLYFLDDADGRGTPGTGDGDSNFVVDILPAASLIHGTDPTAAHCDHLHNLEDLRTLETDTALVPHPDGAGGVEWGEDAGGNDHDVLINRHVAGAHTQYVENINGGGDVINVIADAGSAQELDLALGNVQDVTLTEACVITLASPAAGLMRYMVVDLHGEFDVTWPASVVWDNGVEPTPEAEWTVVLRTSDGGTSWRGHAGAAVSSGRVWMPLTTVVGGVPELVWDDDDSLIPTEVPI